MRPHICPFCNQLFTFRHVGNCMEAIMQLDERTAAEVARLKAEDPAKIIEETVQAWTAMFTSKMGRAPTEMETAAVRALATENLRKLRGDG